jgi:hypothetical protein
MKIMDIIPDKYTKMDTWEKDGVLMCSKECCGSPVSECTCGPECKHCNCFELKKTNESPTGYGMRDGDVGAGMSMASRRQAQSDVVNATKRANNRNADMGREVNVANKSLNRRINRLSKKQPTGLPMRLINPQPAQAPDAPPPQRK